MIRVEFNIACLTHYEQSITSMAPTYLSANSSLSMVVIISAHLPTEHSLFHSHVPLSATEALLSQDRACMEQFIGYYKTDHQLLDSLGNI